MLIDYPTLINNEEIIRPVSWEEQFGITETVSQTEAGTDVVDVSRVGKLTIAAQYKCSSFWAKKFMEWFTDSSLEVKIYDAVTDGYQAHTMRMRNFKKKTVKHSEKIRYGNGLYEVSFQLIEF